MFLSQKTIASLSRWLRMIPMARPLLFYPQGTTGGSEIFSHFRKLETREYPAKFPEKTVGWSPEILVANTRLKIDRDTIRRFPSVRVFATVSSGVDHVNFSDLKREGKVFLNSPGCNAGSVAEYCWAALSEFLDQEEAKKKKIGLIGFGNTGKAFASILSNRGIPFVYNDPFMKEKSVPFEEALDSEIVSFHVPLTKEGPYPTYEMLDLLHADRLRPGAIVLNTSRGEIWSKEAWQRILERKDLLRVLDVFRPEPPTGSDAETMIDLADTILTPHIAGYSQLGRLLGTYRLAKKLCILYEDGPLPPLTDFLKSEAPIRTSTFLKKEDSDLRDAWRKGDWDYFERRRNTYPVRLDMGLFDSEE
ncbi:NAD(P)-dependent oxidoreductase [Leptospira wolffii]|uniref:NAD(P)-dependent oxidoreductase n=1 Tax=Leptospira wolffii TaxID=409998 RepID=UPI001AEFA89D|nr:NAD(P)-dependent oxidoreductase [Leptospira wolffii]